MFVGNLQQIRYHTLGGSSNEIRTIFIICYPLLTIISGCVLAANRTIDRRFSILDWLRGHGLGVRGIVCGRCQICFWKKSIRFMTLAKIEIRPSFSGCRWNGACDSGLAIYAVLPDGCRPATQPPTCVPGCLLFETLHKNLTFLF
jgi:hypothetical protein